MASATTVYQVKRYNDGKMIGKAKRTVEQFADYKAMAQGPEGLIRLGALPHNMYDLDAEHRCTHEDTTVFLD